MSEKEIGALLKVLEESKGRWTLQTSVALRLAPYIILRPLEICEAEWAEIGINAAEWCIPAARMKMSRDHIVPLPRKHNVPISTASLLQAIRRIGYCSAAYQKKLRAYGLTCSMSKKGDCYDNTPMESF